MRADVLTVLPPVAFSKAHGASLRLSLHDVMESEDEEPEQKNQETHNRRVNNASLSWASKKHANSFDCSAGDPGSKLSENAAFQKKRSQSAKRPPQNGSGGSSRSDSPQFIKGTVSSPQKPAPPKSAPGIRKRRSSSKGKGPKSREDSGASTGGETQDQRTASPSPQRRSNGNGLPEILAGGRLRSANCQSRRRLPSRSEELSLGSIDLQSPKSSSDRLHHSLNGTFSSESSDDLRQRHPSVSGVPSAVGGGGGGGGGGGESSDGVRSSSPSPSTSTNTSRAWDCFEDHVRNIHGSGDNFGRHRPSFQASSIFQETMVDLYGYPDYSKPPPPPTVNVAARGLCVAGAAGRFLRLRKRNTGLTGGGFGGLVRPPPEPSRKTVENAKRGWRILKEYVKENYMSKRTSQTALMWTMLRQTLKGLSNVDKTRLDLYRRYGIVPTVDDDGNIVMINTMLSERARKAVANGSRHPLLVHTQRASLPLPGQPSQDKVLSSSLPSALSSSSPMSSSRSSAEGSQHQQQLQRRSRSSGVRVSRGDSRPHSSLSVMNGVGGRGGFLPARNGVRKSSDLSSRSSSSRSHTP
ncbi:uncharacterized protein [Littorina saxatilis]|uniref:uncharacterized protein n=1 Tax=Littorina saxatilis TaxID=31220 RepID=UPI0038B614C6